MDKLDEVEQNIIVDHIIPMLRTPKDIEPNIKHVGDFGMTELAKIMRNAADANPTNEPQRRLKEFLVNLSAKQTGGGYEEFSLTHNKMSTHDGRKQMEEKPNEDEQNAVFIAEALIGNTNTVVTAWLAVRQYIKDKT